MPFRNFIDVLPDYLLAKYASLRQNIHHCMEKQENTAKINDSMRIMDLLEIECKFFCSKQCLGFSGIVKNNPCQPILYKHHSSYLYFVNCREVNILHIHPPLLACRVHCRFSLLKSLRRPWNLKWDYTLTRLARTHDLVPKWFSRSPDWLRRSELG